MSQALTLSQQKEIEHKATNTAGLKDYGSNGLKPDGSPKQGYYRLKDGRVISLVELTGKTILQQDNLPPNIEELSLNPEIRDVKGLGLDADGNVKNGFYRNQKGKVVGIKSVLRATPVNVEQD